MKYIINLLEEAIKKLEQADIETPKLDAEVLLAHALGCERHELYTSTGYLLTYARQKLFEEYVERRKKRELVAYIRGFKEFWSINIKVTPAVLIPRPETEAVVEKALEIIKNPPFIPPLTKGGILILDLCTGSGCIAAALATELPEAQITVADISNEALEVAKENLAFAKGRVTFIQSNLFEKIPSQSQFDLIVSNPPYIPSSQMKQLSPEILRYEPHLALDGGMDGLDFITKIKQTAPKFLKPGGWLVMEAGAEVLTWTNS